MRVRSVVLPAVLAMAAAVLAPTSAQAATKCAMAMPTKVVIDAPRVWTPVTLTSGCRAPEQAEHAYWDLEHNSSDYGFLIDLELDDLKDSRGSLPWDDTDPVGRYTLHPYEAVGVNGTVLDQNTAVTTVKYGSRLVATPARKGSTLSWSVTATHWSPRQHFFVARPKASVGLFHKAPGSKTWKYVKSVTTTNAGHARVAVSSPKAGTYRLKIAETPTVWAAYSKPVQGRR